MKETAVTKVKRQVITPECLDLEPAAEPPPPAVVGIDPETANAITGCKGAPSSTLTKILIHAFSEGVWDAIYGVPNDQKGDAIVGMLSAIAAEMRPQDPIQAMLISEMITTHLLVTRCARSATQHSDVELSGKAAGRAERLMRLFIDQAEALARLQGKTTVQKVVVERVDLQPGSKAIIGAVSGGRGDE
ncbi:MAG: hypothetical protein WA324_19935 [Bryobacteraceae bacterium]